MSTRWTVDQLSAYAKRQLAASANTRREIRERAKIPGSGQRHNPKVVLAFFQHHGVSAPWLEFQFDPDRKWRFDFAWENWEPQLGRWKRVALEVQGGIWTRGRHVRPAALLQEYEKLNRAAVLGWRVLFVTPDQLLTRQTADLIRAALAI